MISLTELMARLWAEVPHGVSLSIGRSRLDVTAWVVKCGPYRVHGTLSGDCTVWRGGEELITYPPAEREDMLESLLAVVNDPVSRREVPRG